jgi:hypothetical protein
MYVQYREDEAATRYRYGSGYTDALFLWLVGTVQIENKRHCVEQLARFLF